MNRRINVDKGSMSNRAQQKLARYDLANVGNCGKLMVIASVLKENLSSFLFIILLMIL